MTPIGGVVGGLVLMIFDVRVGGVDLVPDVASWALVAVSLGKLTGRAQPFALAKSAAVITAVLSLADLVQPTTTVATTSDDLSTFTETVRASPGGLHGGLLFAYMIAMTVVPVLICWAVRCAALNVRDLPRATSFTNLTFAVLAVSALADIYAIAIGASDVFGSGVLLILVAGLGVFVWMLVSLHRVRHLDYLTPAG